MKNVGKEIIISAMTLVFVNIHFILFLNLNYIDYESNYTRINNSIYFDQSTRANGTLFTNENQSYQVIICFPLPNEK